MHANRLFLVSLSGFALALANPVFAQAPAATPGPTYADLATLADGTPMVIHAQILRQITLPPERAPNVAPGHVRLYIEAQTQALLLGNAPIGAALHYLVDVPFDARGKPPKLKKEEVILFARPVAGRPDQVQLVKPDAQLLWSPALAEKLKPILAAFAAPNSPPAITGVSDALSTPGNLTGESDTQIFLTTADGDPAALSIVRRPNMAPHWGVSWTELVDQSAKPAEPDTLEWYRLACGLPSTLPDSANLAQDPRDRAQAQSDYRFVLDQLGPCKRNRG
ncbi:hypothetical protein GRI58_03280 [Porphyrobacter algicida]|uniref:Uncharacterized protein n=1 Tax=Qipengyuania algicida TaxID=1836209 RepID=A0A845AGA3_9SPHN|nr:hypothetical protein [Qipengyuania algicida]MXP27845.1 hypothetical protein [Qipengyuania algicida]